MKLYLSSYRLPVPKELCDLVGKQITDIKIALIPNAKDYYAKKAREIKIGAYVEYFKKLGFAIEVIDLRSINSVRAIEEIFQDYDVAWACGGNTFCLRYEMYRSG